MSKIDVTTTLEQVLKDHDLWLQNIGGSRADLFKADLSRANLSGADLSRALLTRTNFFEADLSGANLLGASLYGADLRRANLSGANLFGAHLFGANLSGANLFGADLSGVHLSGADLSETQYEKDIPIIINTEFYPIVKCKAYIKIKCEQHTPEEWQTFTDEQISKMDSKALEFWNKYKQLILMEIV